ncbi:MAG: urate hydroxylase PuuD [Betaproteobacteria bacterium]|nr:urate hydroxylase PuuD [Betaproteobacteria bacterium]
MSGVMWVGLLYYFNFVQADAMKQAQADGTAAGISKHVAPRALLYFRWAAVVTWLAGMWLLGDKVDEAFLFRERAYIPIGVGAWLGTIMFVNVWAIIWPNQRKILGLAPASDDEKARARRVAFLASRLNVVLSMPMIFFMSASGGLFRTAVFGA